MVVAALTPAGGMAGMLLMNRHPHGQMWRVRRRAVGTDRTLRVPFDLWLQSAKSARSSFVWKPPPEILPIDRR